MRISLSVPPLMDVKDNILSHVSMAAVPNCPSHGIESSRGCAFDLEPAASTVHVEIFVSTGMKTQ